MHSYCNVSHAVPVLNPRQTSFMLKLRKLRATHGWLRENCRPKDEFRYLEPVEGRTVFASYREGPNGEKVFALCHLEGKPTEELEPLSLLPDGIDRAGWKLDLRSPGIGDDYMGGPIILRDSMALVFTSDR
jgi:hypothetical protein